MNLQFVNTHHINYTIPIGTLAEARYFYLKLLGFEELEKPIMFQDRKSFWLKSGMVELHINEDEAHTPSERHAAFIVNNLEEIKQYMLSLDVQLRLSKPFGNYTRFSFYDPFGNRIELMEIVGVKKK